jgi:predicted nucleotidyltransferase
MAAMTPLERITRVLDETPAVRLAVVFGSAARQTEGRDSDIDVGVSWLDGAVQPAAAVAVALERAAGRPVDLVLLGDAPPLLRFEIARDGRVLVERVPHAWADFRAKAMIDWWDWAPTARMMHRVMAERLREEAAHGPA